MCSTMQIEYDDDDNALISIYRSGSASSSKVVVSIAKTPYAKMLGPYSLYKVWSTFLFGDFPHEPSMNRYLNRKMTQMGSIKNTLRGLFAMLIGQVFTWIPIWMHTCTEL